MASVVACLLLIKGLARTKHGRITLARTVLLAFSFAGLAFPSLTLAQRISEMGPIGFHVPPAHAVFASRTDPAASIIVGSESQKRHNWPWFVLGGTVVGGVGAGAFALTHCDQGCKDDGGLAYLPYIVAIGAGLGAVVGLVIGLVADAN